MSVFFRLRTAALYQNENGLRETRLTPLGATAYQRIRQRATNRMHAQEMKVDPTFGEWIPSEIAEFNMK